MRRAVPLGGGCEYPQYPAGGTASVLSTHVVPPANPLGGRRRELCAAWGVQAGNNGGGLVAISGGGTGNVSVVGSTLTNIAVRAHC